jgi:UDP-3-O-[3-hydroxymyristoyl] glucosamine N-acyltransferase
MKAREIADLVGGELVGDADVDIKSVASIDAATAGDIVFIERNAEISTNASCVLVPLDLSFDAPAATL